MGNVNMLTLSTPSQINPESVTSAVLLASGMARALPVRVPREFAVMLQSLEHDIDACVDACSLSDSEVHAADVVERLVTRERLVCFGRFGLGLSDAQITAIVADALLGAE